MTLSKEDLWHNLPLSPAVFFVLRNALSEPTFLELLTTLESFGVPSRELICKKQYWKAIHERFQGTRRWDTLVPRYVGSRDGEGLVAFNESLNNVENIAKHRPYLSYVIDEVRYMIDVFNPVNELELTYRGAGEHVLALLLGNAMERWRPYPVPVRDRLKDVSSFYAILERFANMLEPENICGGFYIVNVVLGYVEGKIADATRPWDFLWTLNVFDATRVEGIKRSDLERTFAKVVELSNGQVLLQVMPGFDSTMGREYTSASRLMKMTPVTKIDRDST